MSALPATATLEEQVWERLEEVVDPCSIATGRPVSIVDLGVVEHVSYDDEARRVTVSLTLTNPGCFFFYQIGDAIEDLASALDRVDDVEIELSDQIWTPDRMRLPPAARSDEVSD